MCVCRGVGGCDRHLVYRESVLQTLIFHAEEGYSSFIETWLIKLNESNEFLLLIQLNESYYYWYSSTPTIGTQKIGLYQHFI